MTALTVTTPDASANVTHRLKRILSIRAVQIILVEIVVIALFFSLSPDGAFLNAANIRGMLLTASQVLLLAVGQAILMAAGKIDISQGAVLILASVASGQVMVGLNGTMSPAAVLGIGLLVALVVGAVLGIITGILVGVVGINSLVATLGMLSLATGVAQVSTGGVNIVGVPGELSDWFGSVRLGAIPLPIVVSLLVIGVVWAVFRFTAWGTHTLATGSNALAARRVGIKTVRNTIGIFVVSSTLAGLAGYIDLARYSTTNISGHTNDSMAAIAAALIGGTALTGGRISFLGAIVGALLAILLQSGLVIIGVSPFYQTIAVGLMLLIAVSLDHANRERPGSS